MPEKKSPVSWISLKLHYPVYHYLILNTNLKIGSSFSLDIWSTQGPHVLSGECMDISMSQRVLFDNTGVVHGNSKFPDLCSWAKSPCFHLSQSPHLLFLISPVWHTGGSFAVFRYSNCHPRIRNVSHWLCGCTNFNQVSLIILYLFVYKQLYWGIIYMP